MFKLFICVFVLLSIYGCADSVTLQSAIEMEKVGFWYGYWHGATFFFSFIGSLFSGDISIYAIYNTGGWYDFGFWLGVASLGTASASSIS